MVSKFFHQSVKLTKNMMMAVRSLFWKRRNDMVLCGAWFGQSFSDNPRYLYQYLFHNKRKLGLTHVVWITGNREVYDVMKKMHYEVYMRSSKESIYFHKRAKYHIICESGSDSVTGTGDILGQYSYRAVRIHLWHGAGALKGVDYAGREYINRKSIHPFVFGFREFLYRHSAVYRLFFEKRGGWSECYYLSSSKEETSQLSRFFLLPEKNYIETNLPRNCKMLKMTPDEKKLTGIIKKYKYCILYLPTFRDENSEIDLKDTGEQVLKYLNREDILWIQKAHFADKKNATERKCHKHCLELPASFDVNVIIPMVSVLVTDYSSVRTDALYHYRPVIFYVPDYVEYKTGSRGFIADPDMWMCGPKVFHIYDLSKAVADYCKEPEKAMTEHYLQQRKKWWENEKDYLEIWNDLKKRTG